MLMIRSNLVPKVLIVRCYNAPAEIAGGTIEFRRYTQVVSGKIMFE